MKANVITGSITFNCSCPAEAASVTVRSRPITRKPTWFTTSGITGLTLPGMIDRTRLHRRQVDLVEAAARAGGEQAQVVADLGELDGGALQEPESSTYVAGVARRLDQVAVT